MASPADEFQIAELEEEMMFQGILLSSINSQTMDREQTEADIKGKMMSLESRLKQLRRGGSSTSILPFTDHMQRSPVLSSASLPQLELSGFLNKVASSSMDLPSRKRSHRTYLDGDVEAGGTWRRASPCLSYDNPATPLSFSDQEAFEHFTGNFSSQFIEEQKRQEDRIKTERMDAYLARSMQDSPSVENIPGLNIPGVAKPPGFSGPSAFQRMAGVAASCSDTSVHVDSGHRDNTQAGPALGDRMGYMGNGSTYQAFEQPVNRSMPGAYIVSPHLSDSDLEIVPPQAFRDNARRVLYQPQITDISSQASSVGAAALRSFQDWVRNESSQMTSYDRCVPQSVYSGTQNANSGLSPVAASMRAQNPAFPPNATANVKSEAALHLPVYKFVDVKPESMDLHSVSTLHDYDLPHDPQRTTQELQDLLSNIRPDADLPASDREDNPQALKCNLYEHQKLALSWMKGMEDGSNKGGILADDMGLGKTISTLSLILNRPSMVRTCKTTLIVGPVALVRQWEGEIHFKIKYSHSLTTFLRHGQVRRASWDDLRNYDVVLTTYGTLAAELRRLEKYELDMKTRGITEWDQGPMKKLFPMLGPKSIWYRVILDEAQWIKNKATNQARAACHLRALHRWALTGTPMQNSVDEFYSLIHFLRIKPYNSYSRFKQDFGILTPRGSRRVGENEVRRTMRKLQAVITSCMLRRTKNSLIDGKPIINLPPKTDHAQHAEFNRDELSYYKSLESRTQVTFNRYVKQGTIGKNYSNILVLLLRLRQACCHPHLIHDFDEAPVASGSLGLPDDALENIAKSLGPEVVARIIAADGFECPVCYDGVENPAIIVPCGHDTCSECLSKISDQATQQNVVAGNENAVAACKCPACRTVFHLNQVIDYRIFKKVHMPEKVDDNLAVNDVHDGSDTASHDSDGCMSDEMSDVDDTGNLRGFIVPDIESSDEDEQNNGDDHQHKDCGGDPKDKFKQRRRRLDEARKGKMEAKEDMNKLHLSIPILKKNAAKSIEGRRRYERYLRKNYLPSAKIEKCMELLEKFHDADEKTIVFSQFVSLLDILHVPIHKKKWSYERYDGGMSADARNDAVMRFTGKPDCKLMLISLKAGNAGLNLTAASRVIILEPFWNPFVTDQAVDRAYRIGQAKPVEIHRVLVQGTVEDRILELQEEKRKLINAALDEGASKSIARLSVRELGFLFGVNS